MKYKKFALSIKGGAARSFGSIGVFRYFQEEGLQPSLIAGSSGGALMAAMYAIGLKWHEMLSLTDDYNFKKLLSFKSLVKDISLVSGAKLRGVFKAYIPSSMKIEDLPYRFIAFASDPNTRERVLIDKGNLIEAVMASCAFPVFFPSPIKIQNRFLIDGDLIPSYSAMLLKSKYNMDRVIGLCNDQKQKFFSRNLSYLDKILMLWNLMSGQLSRYGSDNDMADMEIKYSVGKQSYINFSKIDTIVDGAYKLTCSKREEINAILNIKK